MIHVPITMMFTSTGGLQELQWRELPLPNIYSDKSSRLAESFVLGVLHVPPSEKLNKEDASLEESINGMLSTDWVTHSSRDDGFFKWPFLLDWCCITKGSAPTSELWRLAFGIADFTLLRRGTASRFVSLPLWSKVFLVEPRSLGECLYQQWCCRIRQMFLQ